MQEDRSFSENLSILKMRILKNEYGYDSVDVRKQCLNLLGPAQGRCFLDVGTGSGWMAILAARHGFRTLSIDLDAITLRRALDQALQAGLLPHNAPRFFQADATRLPFLDQSMDVVCCYEALHHFQNFTCWNSIVEMRRVCKPGAIVLIADLNHMGRDAVKQLFVSNNKVHYANRCNVPNIRRMLEEAFGKVTAHAFQFEIAYFAHRSL